MIRAVVGVCPECLRAGTVPLPSCAACQSDDPPEIDLVATASRYTPPREGRRTGYDRFPDPPEPAEFRDVTVIRGDTGAEMDPADIPAATWDALDEALVEAAQDHMRDAAEARADAERDRALDERGE